MASQHKKIFCCLAFSVLISFPEKSNSEAEIDSERLQYCKAASSSAAIFAKLFFEEGSNGITERIITQIDDIDLHFFNITFLSGIQDDRNNYLARIEEMYDLLVPKYGEVGAFEFLQTQVNECLIEFPM